MADVDGGGDDGGLALGRQIKSLHRSQMCFQKRFFFFNACVSDYQRLKDRLQNGT